MHTVFLMDTWLSAQTFLRVVLKLRLQLSATPPWKALLSDRSPLSTMHKESIQKLGKLYLSDHSERNGL